MFGFGKKKKEREDVGQAQDEELDYVLFRGALNGQDANLAENARLAQAGLLPAKELVTDALLRGAEAFRLDPKGNVSVVTLSIDGVGYPGGRLPRQQGLAVTQMMKLLSGLDIRERRRPQSGGVKAEFQDTPYELRVESVPTQAGVERLSVRAINLKNRLETPEDIGFPDELKAKVREFTSERSGVLLACGPPKSGTSTTVIGLVKSVDAYLYSVYCIADLGGRELSHVTHVESQPDDDLETLIERSIRSEADVLMLDPIRDAETAKTIFSFHDKVSLISEFVARDSSSGITQLVKWVGDAQALAEGLKALVSQKLIRLLCEDCRQAYRPNPKLLGKVGLPPEIKLLYRPTQWSAHQRQGDVDVEACDACGGIGYRGRTAIFELIEMTDSIREAVAAGAAPEQIKTRARKEGMPNFRTEGLRLVATGKTSLEELQRVFKPA